MIPRSLAIYPKQVWIPGNDLSDGRFEPRQILADDVLDNRAVGYEKLVHR